MLFTIETCINLCARYFAVPMVAERLNCKSATKPYIYIIFIDYFNRSYSRLFSSQLKTSDFIHFTRQHSSRMCTAHLSLYQGVVSVGGASPCTETPQTHSPDRDPPQEQETRDPRRNMGPVNQTGSEIIETPSPCGQTDTCKNITLPQTSFVGTNNDNSYIQPYLNIFAVFPESIIFVCKCLLQYDLIRVTETSSFKRAWLQKCA